MRKPIWYLPAAFAFLVALTVSLTVAGGADSSMDAAQSAAGEAARDADRTYLVAEAMYNFAEECNAKGVIQSSKQYKTELDQAEAALADAQSKYAAAVKADPNSASSAAGEKTDRLIRQAKKKLVLAKALADKAFE